MQKKKKVLYLWIVCIIAVLLSCAAVFCVPEIVDWAMGKGTEVQILSAAALPAAGILILCLTAVLRIHLRRDDTISYASALGRIFLTLCLFCGSILIISLFCGLLAVFLYFGLKSILTLSQIKGSIDILVTVIDLLLLPFFASILWQEVSGSDRFLVSVAGGLRTGWKKYPWLFLTGLCTFGAGCLIIAVFYNVPQNIGTDVLKAFLLSMAGAAALAMSGRICMNIRGKSV